MQGLGLTYKKSGVDIHKASEFKGKIKYLVRGSMRKEVLKGIGGFGSFFAAPKGFKEPVLVSSADGVGTKLKIATLINKHDTIGIDAVAMNVNDILCTGAETLFFLDYIAYSKLPEKTLLDILKGLNEGCLQAGCSLVGGETAQMPGMYKDGEYDLAGFCVGVVEKKKIIDGSQIKAGDLVIGIESSGIHSNGYSLVRKVLSIGEQKKMAGELLKPTRIYVKPVLSLLQGTPASGRQGGRGQVTEIHGISHITGGAFYDKISRILPQDIDVLIHKSSWPVPDIFKLIQVKGRISDQEMFSTFNMGIGMVLLAPDKFAKDIQMSLSKNKLRSWVIGEAIKGSKKVKVA